MRADGHALLADAGCTIRAMEPRIQYAKTSDGVSIAYAEAGEGTPVLVVSPAGFSHVELGWEAFAPVHQGLATRFRTLWFDYRGTGLSDRSAVDFTLDAALRDVEAVVEEARLRQFVLGCWGAGAMAGIAYLAAHPERVSHLILCDGCSSYTDFGETAVVRAAMPLLEIDWQLYTETFGQVMWAFANPEFGRGFGEVMRVACDQKTHRAIWRAWVPYDVTPLLPAIAVPTLVVHNKENRLFLAPVAQRLAASIRGARLSTIDDITYSVVPDMIERFVRGSGAAPVSEPTPTSTSSGTAIILFADIVDSTALTERMGDTAFRAKARELDGALRTIIRDAGGTPIEGKLLGDGVLAVFTSARQAIEAALACGAAGESAGLPLHLGLHAGDVIREGNNIYGGAVNIASRISGLSAPGVVMVSETVRSLARTSAGVSFEDRGEQLLKGVAEPQRVFAVRETN